MVNVFISFPMRELTYQQIIDKMEMYKTRLNMFFGKNANYIDSIVEYPAGTEPLWCLGKSIEKLSEADVAVFAGNWRDARGCVIEHECANQYGISIFYLN